MPPKTLTKREFAQTAAAKKPGASFEQYLDYVAKRRKPVAVDPFAPTPDAEIRQRINADINAEINPRVAAETSRITGLTKAGMGAIGGYTNQLAEKLKPLEGQVADIYGDAQRSSAATDNALLQTLRGQGTDLSAQLSQTLGQINAPGAQVDQVAGGAAQTGAGASGALQGIGSAALNELISRGASARDHAAKQPGIARMGGLAAGRDLQLSSGRELADNVGRLKAEIPALFQGLYRKAQDDEWSKDVVRETRRKDGATAAANAVADADKAAQAWTRIQQAGERLALQAGNTSFNQGIANSKLELSQKQYRLAMQKEARLAKAPGKKGGFTPAQKQNMAETAFDTVTDAIEDDATPKQILNVLVTKGIPFSIAMRVIQSFANGAKAGDPSWKATLGWTK